MCERHALACVQEYEAKLGEIWTLQPIETPESWSARIRWKADYLRALMPTPPSRQIADQDWRGERLPF
jgi:hypothetical protein